MNIVEEYDRRENIKGNKQYSMFSFLCCFIRDMQTVIIIAGKKCLFCNTRKSCTRNTKQIIINITLKPSLVSFSHHPYTHISASFSSSPWATPSTVFRSVFLTQPTSPRDFAVFWVFCSRTNNGLFKTFKLM